MILRLPESFYLPLDLFEVCLKVTKSACQQTVKYWIHLGLLKVINQGKAGKLSLYKRKLLQLQQCQSL